MSRIEIGRHVAADSASVALLLAELASDETSERELVVAQPRRAGVGFAAPLEFTVHDGDVVAGVLVVEPSTEAGCEVRAGFDVPDRSAARQVERAGTTFLSALAADAKSRSFAA